MPSPGPMTARSARRSTHYLDSRDEWQPIKRRGSHYDEEWDSEIGKWVRVKDSRSGSMDTQNGRRDKRRKSRNNSRKNSRRHSVRRGSSRAVPPKPTRQKTVGFQDPPRTPRRTSSGRRMSRRRASQSSEESLTNAEMAGREYRESKAKEKATKKMLEQEAAEKKERDEKANAPKPKNDKFVLPTEERGRGTGGHILENWVLNEANDEMDRKGEKLAAADGHEFVTLADRRKVGEPEDSADWVAVRDQNNHIVHIRASQRKAKPLASVEPEDNPDKLVEDMEPEELKLKMDLAKMADELAKINKDDGAVLDTNVVESSETRKAEGLRLQEMQKQLKNLRNGGQDKSIRELETALAKAQLKHDHPELAPSGRLEYDDEDMIKGASSGYRPAGQQEGLAGDSGMRMRRRGSSGYIGGAQAFQI